jgi:hypothetical protein
MLTCPLPALPCPQAVVVTADGRQVLTGGDRGMPCLRWTANLAVAHRYMQQPQLPQLQPGAGGQAGASPQPAPPPAAITALALTNDESCFVAGSASGGCMLYCCQEGGLHRRTNSGSSTSGRSGSAGGLVPRPAVNLAVLGPMSVW